MTATLVLATRNAGKVVEIRHLLSDMDIQVLTLDAFENAPEVEETGVTFQENAELKAKAIAAFTRQWTLADDSGLEVKALGGRPGVYSARYAGTEATDTDRYQKLLDELQGVTEPDRQARFQCVAALATPEGAVTFFKGICSGRIIFEPRGRNGFGFDPVFLPEGYSQTMAELSLEDKNTISHRSLAVKQACAHLKRLLITWH